MTFATAQRPENRYAPQHSLIPLAERRRSGSRRQPKPAQIFTDWAAI